MNYTNPLRYHGIECANVYSVYLGDILYAEVPVDSKAGRFYRSVILHWETRVQ